jgi:two-component system response regulator AtoC
VGPLAEHFLRKYARKNAPAPRRPLPERGDERLRGYAWPGNVRELENGDRARRDPRRGDGIQPAHLAFAEVVEPLAPASPVVGEERALDTKLEELERAELVRALEACGGKKAEVARMLGIQRTTLYYRLKKLGIDA